MALPKGIERGAGDGGLERIRLDCAAARGEIYLHGATATSWIPDGQAPVLWVSRQARFDPHVGIRGGIPICFPWFGPKQGDGAAPKHGFARTAAWRLEGVEARGEVVEVAATLGDDDTTRAQWPYRFAARYRIRFGRRKLELSLSIENRDERPLAFEAALHAYFAVGDVRQVQVLGLEGATYIDKVDQLRRKVEGTAPVRIDGPIDRVYLGVPTGCELVDPVLGRRISIQKDGAQTTVVWNPAEVGARQMQDFGDDEWPQMLCIEPANAADDAVSVEPGRAHEMRVRITVND